MIPSELETQILRHHHADKWPIGTISRQLGVHHTVVRRVLTQAGVESARRHVRPSKVDPFVPFIIETLERWPTLQASRIYEMVKDRGYTGQPDHFRSIISRYRPRRPSEAYARLRTLPGEQAQVDWAHFGKVRIGEGERHLMAFVMVLSYSRMISLRFYLNARMESFIRGHLDAFEFFGGVPRVLLYDNLKSAVLERIGPAIRFNPRLLELASHHHFEPRPVAPARGNQKGRVERAIRYIRGAFFAGRTWTDVTDLNRQARDFCLGIASDRKCPDDLKVTVREAFERERTLLLRMPEAPFPDEERFTVAVGKTPYARFDGNDYSVPHSHVQRELTLFASPTRVRIVADTEVVAEHERCWDRGRHIEDPRHIEGLLATKQCAARHSGQNRLFSASPKSRELLKMAAEHGLNLGSLVAKLLKELDLHGSVLLDEAISEAVARGAPRLGSIRQEIDRRRHQRGLAPAVEIPLPDDPSVRNIIVTPHRLEAYDALDTNSGAPDVHPAKP